MTLTDGGDEGADGLRIFDELVCFSFVCFYFICTQTLSCRLLPASAVSPSGLPCLPLLRNSPTPISRFGGGTCRHDRLLTHASFSQALQKAAPSVQVMYVNMPRIFGGSNGVMHAKFLVTDADSFYLGSANFGRKRVASFFSFLFFCL
jgi:hypothetical protein